MPQGKISREMKLKFHLIDIPGILSQIHKNI